MIRGDLAGSSLVLRRGFTVYVLRHAFLVLRRGSTFHVLRHAFLMLTLEGASVYRSHSAVAELCFAGIFGYANCSFALCLKLWLAG